MIDEFFQIIEIKYIYFVCESCFSQEFSLFCQAALHFKWFSKHEHFLPIHFVRQEHFWNPCPVPRDKLITILRRLDESWITSEILKPLYFTHSKQLRDSHVFTIWARVPILNFSSFISMITPTTFDGSPRPLSYSDVNTATQSPFSDSFNWLPMRFNIFSARFLKFESASIRINFDECTKFLNLNNNFNSWNSELSEWKLDPTRR